MYISQALRLKGNVLHCKPADLLVSSCSILTVFYMNPQTLASHIYLLYYFVTVSSTP